jgi:hypothetical protein
VITGDGFGEGRLDMTSHRSAQWPLGAPRPREEIMSLSHQDITEIQQVQALYGHAVDWPDQSLLPKVFAKDGVFDARPTGSNLYEGLDAICAWFGLGKPPHPKVHIMTNVWVYEEGGETRVKSKWLVRNLRNDMVFMGDYDDVMVRTPEGWRIRHRVCVARDPGPNFVQPPEKLEAAR